jgi:hypothetical protein
MIGMLMFIGHIGILSFLFLILGKEIKETYIPQKNASLIGSTKVQQGTLVFTCEKQINKESGFLMPIAKK